jgi:hypothetical protein
VSFRNVTDHLSSVADRCYAIWQESPAPPPSEQDASSISQDLGLSVASQILHRQSSESDISAVHPSNQEVGNGIISVAPDHGVSSVQSLLEQLKTRGKGKYFCPHGMSCDKGGVINGQLKEFNRNSDFR